MPPSDEHSITLRWMGDPPSMKAESFTKRLAYLVSGEDIIIEVDGEAKWGPGDGPPHDSGWVRLDATTR